VTADLPVEADVAAAAGREVQAGVLPNPLVFAETTDGVLYDRLDSA
jgi:hypothetical protein